MQTLQKSSFSGKSLLFTLISFPELETNTQYSIIEIERDDAERADLGRVSDMKSDAGALIVIPDTNYPHGFYTRFRKAGKVDACRHLIDRVENFFHVDVLLYNVVYRLLHGGNVFGRRCRFEVVITFGFLFLDMGREGTFTMEVFDHLRI